MTHPLKCNDCSEYRYLRFEDLMLSNDTINLRIKNTPHYYCANCDSSECVFPVKMIEDLKSKYFATMQAGEYFIEIEKIYPRLNSSNKFSLYDHLEFSYDARDYYIIPGLYRDWNDGYLTPVFFDRDILLYYNNHPDYQVKFFSFSSGDIFYNNKPLFKWGFGINRSGKLFMWLGDLEEDLGKPEMKNHLKRFQSSNIDSDHDIFSKFYLSQIPFSFSDAFQSSDNEYNLLEQKNKLDKLIFDKFKLNISRTLNSLFNEIYRHPILEERNQIFSAYLSLTKLLIESIRTDNIRKIIRSKNREANMAGLGSLKLFDLFLHEVCNENDTYDLMTPFYVLYDLRLLHGHLSNENFETEYNDCKERLGLATDEVDFNVYKTLVSNLIETYVKVNEIVNLVNSE